MGYGFPDHGQVLAFHLLPTLPLSIRLYSSFLCFFIMDYLVFLQVCWLPIPESWAP